MDEPQTLVLHEERTIIDGDQPDTAEPLERKAAARLTRIFRAAVSGWRSAAVATLIVALGVWVYGERRHSQKLEGVIFGLRQEPGFRELPSESQRGLQPGSVVTKREGSVDLESPPADRVDPGDAVELIIQNRLELALRAYRRLAIERSSEPVYQDVVRVLRSKLTCRTDAGLPCEP